MALHFLCTICTEAFELNSDISAIPCGHTFHEHCLQRWLSESMTCPQCRIHCVHRSIIRKLYFNQADENSKVEDSGKIRNELENLKLALKQKDRDRSEILSEKDNLLKQLEELRGNCRSFELLYQEEKASNHSLRRELRCFQALQKDAEAAREEAKEIRLKLQTLQNVENVIKGCHEEVQTMLSNYANDAEQLATWCTVIQRELQTKRNECRSLREVNEKTKREFSSKQRALLEKTDELAASREQIRLLEEDLRSSEAQISSLTRKVQCLQTALNSPSDSRSMSLAKRLLNESPAPDMIIKRPRLSSTPTMKSSIPVFNSPDLFDDQSCASAKQIDMDNVDNVLTDDNKLQSVKIRTVGPLKPLSENSLAKANNLSSVVPNLQQFNLFKRKTSGCSGGSLLMKTGYNGLGGYEKHILPMMKSNTANTNKTSIKLKSRTKSSAFQNPPLPKLDNFIVLN